jgi:AraC-like DNA-binding protein
MGMRGRDALPQLVAVVHTETVYPPRAQPTLYRHDFHVIGLRVRGNGSYRLGPQEIPSGGKVLSIALAGEDDLNGIVGPGESWWVGFRWPGWRAKGGPDGVELPWGGRGARVPRWKPLDEHEFSRLVNDFRALRAAAARTDVGGAFAAAGQLLALIGAYIDLPGASRPAESGMARALAAFRRELERRACDDVRIDDLARAAGASPDHLRELFRARYGQRPHEFRDGLRLSRACDLLASGEAVKATAERCGYRDALYFSRAFRRRFGLPPSEARRRWRSH